MANYIIVTSNDGVMVLSESNDLKPVPQDKVSDILALVAERRRIGRELSMKLKGAGMVTADEEETVVIPPP